MKKVLNHFTTTIIIAIFTLFSQWGIAQYQNHYTIKADIDPVRGLIEGSVCINYVFSNEQKSFILVKTRNPVDYRHHDVIIHNVTDNQGNIINLQPYMDESHLYMARFPKLPEKDTFEFIIHFSSSIITQPHYDFMIVQGIWYPKPVVCRNGKYSMVEEQPDQFDVHLTVPAEYKIFSSGTVKKEIIEENIKKAHLLAENITNFGFVLAEDLISNEITVQGIKITGVFSKELEQSYCELLPIAANVIEFYIETFGFYPQPALVILQGSKTSTGGFPLASNMVMIHQQKLDDKAFKTWITAHETGHQIWGFDYMTDSREHANWLGLGLGFYADRLFNQKMNPAGNAIIPSLFNRYMKGVAQGYNTTLMQDYEALSELEFDWNNIISHGKGYVVIHLLEQIIGEDLFFDLVKHLLENYGNGYLSVKDFQKEAEKISLQDLEWFFDDWVYGNKSFDFRIDTVLIENDNFKIHINKFGDARLPINLEIFLENNSKLVYPIDPEKINQVIIIHDRHKPDSIHLDQRFSLLLPDEKSRSWYNTGVKTR